jgi:hypothetical protein
MKLEEELNERTFPNKVLELVLVERAVEIKESVELQ